MQTRNPATGEPLSTWAPHDDDEVERRLSTAHAAWLAWAELPIDGRAPHLEALAEALQIHRERLASLMTTEMGKPITEARAEVDKCAWVCRHYAAHAADQLAPRPVEAKAPDNVVRYEPLGLVFGVMPWNFPLWQVFRFAAPALMAGNGVLFKHSENTLGCAAAIEQVALECGLPEGLLLELRLEHDRVPPVIADRRVSAVTVTGSERAGAAVAHAAGRHLKPSVLELGGSDPFIVLADADLDDAMDAAVQSRCLNNGQSCIAAKRFIVEAPVYDRFVDGVVQRMGARVVGDPADESTELGPMARRDLRDQLHQQVLDSVEAGAVLRTGGHPLDRPGAWYAATVLTDIPPGCPAATEELFGPVASIFRADDAEHAVALANDTRFGLSSSLWTADRDRARKLATQIRAGAVFVNQMSYSDPRLPFGGIKDSGYGRELGIPGARSFVNVKTVSVA